MNTIEGEWQSYKTEVLPKEMSPVQNRETKRSFHAGARSILHMLFNSADEDISEEAQMEILRGLWEESDYYGITVGSNSEDER